MLIASYQALYLPFGSMDAAELIAEQLVVCEREGAEILCCPESIVGGLAHESVGQSQASVAVRADNGELRRVLGPLLETSVTVLVPARVLAAKGAAIIFVPTNSGHLPSAAAADALRPKGRNLPLAREVENSTTVVVSDIAGTEGQRHSLGSTCVLDPDRTVLAAADPGRCELLIVEVESKRRPHNPRGWDGYTNAAVARTLNPAGGATTGRSDGCDISTFELRNL